MPPTPGMESSEQLYLAIQHSARRFRLIDEDLGLSPARFSVLAALRYGGPRRIGDLARHEGLSQPTVTQTVTALEDAGLVRRRADPVDGRGRVVELTAEGRALVRRARARKIAWVRASVAPRPATEQDIVAAVAAELDRRAH